MKRLLETLICIRTACNGRMVYFNVLRIMEMNSVSVWAVCRGGDCDINYCDRIAVVKFKMKLRAVLNGYPLHGQVIASIESQCLPKFQSYIFESTRKCLYSQCKLV